MKSSGSKMTWVVPYTQFPAPEDGRHQYTFYLHGGLDAQIAVLAKRVGEQVKTLSKAFVFYQREGRYESNANKALEFLQVSKITDSQLVVYEGGPTQRLADLVDLQAYPDSVVLFLGSSCDLVDMFSNPSLGQQSPQLFLPGFFVNSHILKLADVYAKRLEKAYITVPGGNEGTGLTKFRQFMRRNELHNTMDSAVQREIVISTFQPTPESIKNGTTINNHASKYAGFWLKTCRNHEIENIDPLFKSGKIFVSFELRKAS